MALSKPKKRYGRLSESQVSASAPAAHQVQSAASHHDVERRGPWRLKCFAQGVAHCAESLVDIGVVRLSADDEKHIGLLEPVLVTDARDLLHLLVRRVAAEIRRDNCVVAEDLRDQRVCAAPECRREIVPWGLMTNTSDWP
jgi:hypothetical protein